MLQCLVYSPTPGLLYDRMNKELVFTLILIWMGASFGPAPLGLNLYAYIICLVLLAIGMGMNIAGRPTYICTSQYTAVHVFRSIYYIGVNLPFLHLMTWLVPRLPLHYYLIAARLSFQGRRINLKFSKTLSETTRGYECN